MNSPKPREFEIYESGDPYSSDWDASQVTEIGTFYMGGAHAPKVELVRRLRRDYPGCVIRYRNSNRIVRMK